MNMKQLSGMVAGVAIGFALTAGAWTQEVSVWKGETTVVRWMDACTLGTNAVSGVSLRFGTLKDVKFLEDPRGIVYRTAADRVAWDIDEVGPHILEIAAAPEVKSGVYHFGDLVLTVVDCILPPSKDWKYYLDIWQHPWAVSRWHGVAPFSAEHYAAMRPLWEMLAGAGAKVITTTILDLPWDRQCYDGYYTMIRHERRADGRWAFDYSLFDEYVMFAKSCGLGPDIACYTMCPWRRELKLDDGEWGQFLVDFKKHLVAKGWFDNTYIAMDERDPDEVKRLADFIRAHAPGMRISMAGKKVPTAFSHIGIENYSQYIKYSDGSHIAEAKRRHAEGKITTFYVCTGPVHPNNQLRSPLVENFWIGAYPAFSGMDGFLRWSWNSWPRDPLTDASFGDWAAGETFLVYPDGSPSMRFLELRNGIVAAEKVRILREAGALDQPKYDELVRRYDFVDAQSNRVDFVKLKAATLELVNGAVRGCK